MIKSALSALRWMASPATLQPFSFGFCQKRIRLFESIYIQFHNVHPSNTFSEGGELGISFCAGLYFIISPEKNRKLQNSLMRGGQDVSA